MRLIPNQACQPRKQRLPFAFTLIGAVLIALGAGTAKAHAGYVCFWPQENYTLGCSTSLSLSTNGATGWKNADGSFRIQTQVKLSVFAPTTANARVRERRLFDPQNPSCSYAPNCDVSVNVNAGNTYYFFTNGPVETCWRNLAQVTSAGSTVKFNTSSYTGQSSSTCP